MKTWNTFTRFGLPLVLVATCVAGAAAQDQAEKEREAARLEQLRRREMEMRLQEQEAEKAREAAVRLKVLHARDLEIAQLQRRHEINLDQSIFQPDGTAAGARRRIDTQLTAQIEEIDQACKLSDAQKKKLQLAGRGDIKRFFDRCEEVKQKFQSALPQEKLAEAQQDISRLRMTLQSGLFHEDSLLYKALANTLTAEQFARYEVVARERRATRHRSNIETALKVLERGKPLPEARRRELLTLLTNETKPSRRSGPYEHYRILAYLGRLPPERLQALFGDTHWATVSPLLAQYVATEPRLRQSGLLPPEDEDD